MYGTISYLTKMALKHMFGWDEKSGDGKWESEMTFSLFDCEVQFVLNNYELKFGL